MKLTIFTDGASRGNPGLSGAGAILYTKKPLSIIKFLGIKTCNEAEHFAMYYALAKAKELKANNIIAYADSALVVKQIMGVWKAKAEKLKPIIEKSIELKKSFKSCKLFWIPRGKNIVADKLANDAIDMATPEEKKHAREKVIQLKQQKEDALFEKEIKKIEPVLLERLPIGKYNRRFFKDIYYVDKPYLIWLLGNILLEGKLVKNKDLIYTLEYYCNCEL